MERTVVQRKWRVRNTGKKIKAVKKSQGLSRKLTPGEPV
jgi:hypothetical protein